MRQVRPPPKVLPPKPPGYLFEPNPDVAPPSSFHGDDPVANYSKGNNADPSRYLANEKPPPSMNYKGDSYGDYGAPKDFRSKYDNYPKNGPDSISSRSDYAPYPEEGYQRSKPMELMQPRAAAAPPSFDNDVEEQMRLIESNLRSMLGGIGGVGGGGGAEDAESRPYDYPPFDEKKKDFLPPKQSPRYEQQQPSSFPAKYNDYIIAQQQQSPAKRKGAGMNSMYEPSPDALKLKAEKQAAYSSYLQQQVKKTSFSSCFYFYVNPFLR
jgi:hypothetical protein